MIAELPAKGSHLADLTLWRNANGSIMLSVTHMEPRLIETPAIAAGARMSRDGTAHGPKVRVMSCRRRSSRIAS
jgi:hypothetical protein